MLLSGLQQCHVGPTPRRVSSCVIRPNGMYPDMAQDLRGLIESAVDQRRSRNRRTELVHGIGSPMTTPRPEVVMLVTPVITSTSTTATTESSTSTSTGTSISTPTVAVVADYTERPHE